MNTLSITAVRAETAQQRPENKQGRNRLPLSIILIGLTLMLLFSIAVAVSIGQVSIPLDSVFRVLLYKATGRNVGGAEITGGTYIDVVWDIRLPRVILSIVVGVGLALCGTVMQAALQNPLAEPFILGVSSGASFGATFAILFGLSASGFLGSISVPCFASLGAFIAALLVLIIGNVGSRASAVKLILAGTAITALCTALSNLLLYFASNAEGVQSVTFWTMGSLASAEWSTLPTMTFIVGAATIFFLTQSRIMNSMLVGDESATTLGVNPNFYRKLYLIITALVTGTLVASCGVIGFVGLIVPHIARSVVGSHHKRLIPITVLLGALFLTWADVAARVVAPGTELPIGIVTSVLGAPLFIRMLVKKEYGFGGNAR